MENKALKRILVMAIVFVIVFSNCGLTLQALATSDGISIFGLSLFGKSCLDYKAYFLDENGKEMNKMTADVNGEMTLVLELEPKQTGYLKTGTITAIADEVDSNFEFKEILNLSANSNKEVIEEVTGSENVEEKEELEQVVQLEQTLLQTEQIMNTKLPVIELPDNSSTNDENNRNIIEENTITNTIENAVSEKSTVIPDDTNITSNNVVQDAEPADGQAAANDIPTEGQAVDNQEQEVLVDEEKVYEEEAKEKEENSLIPVTPISAKINSTNEIVIENVAESTKIYVKLSYKSGETLNIADLYKETNLDFVGTYINKDLEEVVVSDTDKVTTEWTYSKDIAVSTEITKVSPFEVEGTKGTLIENKITLNRNCTEENYLPLKETVIEFEAPQINGKLPVALDVRASKLKATLGEEINEITFSSENWTYDKDKNTITIKVENPNAVLTNGEDTYIIVYRYDEYVESEEITVDLKGTVRVEEYSGRNNNIITKEFSGQEKTIVNIGELVTYSIGTTDDLIGRGKINANYNSAEAVYETEFISTVSLNILTNDVLREFTLKDTKEFYIDKSNLEFEATDVKYKSIKFKYTEIADIIAQGGTIEVRSNTGEILNTLNNLNVFSQENCEIALVGDIHGIEISIKDIKVNGTITVDILKSIGKCAYEKFAFNNFEKIESRVKAEVKYGTSDDVIELTPLKTEKYFEKSYTKAEISMNTTQLSTIADNENVELKIDLYNNNENSDLYINPEFEVIFPAYVQEVEVKAVNLLYEEGLTIKNINLFKDEKNIQRMKIQLEGVQREFSTSEVTNGTNIIINTKIVVDDYTPKKDDQLKMYYFNQGVTNYQAQTDWKISSSIPEGIIKTTNGFDIEVFSFQAPSGFITANGIENYDGLGSTIKTIKQGEVIAKAGMGEVTRDVTMTLAALNNTGNDCSDIIMLGRVPNQDATDVITGEKLETNTNTTMISPIIQADNNPIGCDIYYSYNPKADRALSNGQNEWTKNPEDFSKVKSFMIIPTSRVGAGTLLKFSYNFQVPANLPYEVAMYGSFGAYYNNITDLAVVYESTKADLVGLVTDNGPKIEATLSTDIGNGAKILSARKMKYILTVVNSGSISATNVKATVPVPEYTTYFAKTENCNAGDYGYMPNSSKKEVEYEIGTLNPGETKTYEFYVKTSNKPENEEHFYITNKATVTTDILANPVESNEVKNELEYANFDTSITLDYDRDMIEGYETNFELFLTNISRKDLNNVVAVFDVGNVYNYISGTINDAEGDITFNSEEGKIYFKLGTLPAYEKSYLKVKVQAKNISKGLEEHNCRFEITSSDIGSTEYSTIVPQFIVKGILFAKDNTINPKSTIKEGEIIVVSTEITNIGQDISKDTYFECEIPNNMEIMEVESSNQGQMSTGNGTGKIEDYIPSLKPGETTTIDIKLQAKNTEGKDPIQVTLNRIVKQKGQEDIKLAPFTFTVLNTELTEEERIDEEQKHFEEIENKYNEEHKEDTPNETPGPDDDNNQPQQPDNNNQLQPPNNNQNDNNNQPTTPTNPIPSEENNTPVQEPVIEKYSIKGIAWVDENKNGAREDEEKGLSSIKVYLLTVGHTMVKSTTTDSSGVYRFTDVENGKYIIAFAYDSSLYITTVYKKGDVGEDRNSDVIESNTDDMNAITNTITVENANVEHIDIGLQNRDVFDLEITKTLSKARVTTKRGTKEYKYNNLDLAKIDIRSKEIKGAKVELEYTITLENKGSLEGYADQVVDYIGQDIVFDESKNTDWYKGNDGYIYMKNINQTALNPGQKKEYKISLVKEMTEENTGTISNKVEILKALSNSAESEVTDNNTSVQNTIITVATGRAVTNTIIIIFIIGVLAGLGYTNKLPIDIHFNKVYKSKDKKISLKKFYK